MNTRNIYNVRIVYKNGYTHDFDVYDLEYTKGKDIVWEGVSIDNCPVYIGTEDICAVWIIRIRRPSFCMRVLHACINTLTNIFGLPEFDSY